MAKATIKSKTKPKAEVKSKSKVKVKTSIKPEAKSKVTSKVKASAKGKSTIKSTVKSSPKGKARSKEIKVDKKSDDDCCPEFQPKKWDEKTFKWKNKPFVIETIPTLFHIPFPPMIGGRIKKMDSLIEKAGMNEKKKEDTLVLFADPTPFRSNILISTKGKVAGANNTVLNGTFVAKVFDGGYNAIPKFVKVMNEYLAKKTSGKISSVSNENYFVHYAYCPNCAKKHGHNYMILFAKID